jgi:hypothetical protein
MPSASSLLLASSSAQVWILFLVSLIPHNPSRQTLFTTQQPQIPHPSPSSRGPQLPPFPSASPNPIHSPKKTRNTNSAPPPKKKEKKETHEVSGFQAYATANTRKLPHRP